jgi:hypothetical protein
MKLFKIAPLVALVAGQIALGEVESHVRSRRDTVISLSGNESSDDLLELLHQVAGDGKDEIDEAIRALMGIDRNIGELQTRKFRNLKLLVLWLQSEQKFGKYCYYGCYCLPEGSHNIAAGGYGKPVDGIDRACFDFRTCYKCLLDEHEDDARIPTGYANGKFPAESCAGELVGYQANLVENDGVRSIECTNKLGACRRNICECDRRLAIKLGELEQTWDVTKHAVKGNFKREDNCFRAGGGPPFEECCGDRTDFPYNQPRNTEQCCAG